MSEKLRKLQKTCSRITMALRIARQVTISEASDASIEAHEPQKDRLEDPETLYNISRADMRAFVAFRTRLASEEEDGDNSF